MNNARVDRHQQWALRLAVATSIFLFVMTLSGLALWLAPFSVPTQILVFAHTLLGVLFFLPVSWYLVKHWWTYRGHLMTHIKLLGYIGVFVVLACNVSGIVLTAQALFARAISSTWDTVHVVTTFAILAFVVPHIVLIVVRDWKAHLTGVATAIEAARAHGTNVIIGTLAVVAAFALLVYPYPAPRLTEELPADYSFAYGPERPFAPSLAVTETDRHLYPTVVGAIRENCTC